MFHLYHGIHFVHDFSDLSDAQKMITWLVDRVLTGSLPLIITSL